MTTYTVTPTSGTAFTVRAENVEHASGIAVRRLHGRRAVAVRTTGTRTLSGYFQPYRPAIGGGMNSTGDPFHVG